MPQTHEALGELRALPKGYAKSRIGEAILASVKSSLEIDHKSLPQPDGRPDELTESAQAAAEVLKLALKIVSEREGIAPKLIASSADIEAIAANDAAPVPLMSGWRRGLFGDVALELKSGRAVIGFQEGPRPDIPRVGSPGTRSSGIGLFDVDAGCTPHQTCQCHGALFHPFSEQVLQFSRDGEDQCLVRLQRQPDLRQAAAAWLRKGYRPGGRPNSESAPFAGHHRRQAATAGLMDRLRHRSGPRSDRRRSSRGTRARDDRYRQRRPARSCRASARRDSRDGRASRCRQEGMRR